MYWIPDPSLFRPEEIFPPSIIAREGHVSPWRLIDSRITKTAVYIRKHYNKRVVINNYLWGGKFTMRGFRPFNLLVDLQALATGKLKPKFSSFTSQHGFGRALDMDIEGITADEAREDIRKNPGAQRYKYITEVEENVSWLHIGCRSWDKSVSGILFF